MTSKSFDISVIIPCYNEESSLSKLLEEGQIFRRSPYRVQIVLVDNGSTDQTLKRLSELSPSEPNLKIVQVPKNLGYGHGILQGLAEADSEILAWTHADLQTPLRDILKGLELFQQNFSRSLLIKGRRKKRTVTGAFYTIMLQAIASLVLRTRLSDISAQPKLFHRDFYNRFLKDAPWDFSLDLYCVYRAKTQGQLMDFPVDFNPRQFGESKGGESNFRTKFKIIRRNLNCIWSLYLNSAKSGDYGS